MVTKKLKCEECGGIMEIDETKSIICCPYCGSKELIDESDAVKIAKIESDAEIQMFEKKTHLKTEFWSCIGTFVAIGLALLFCYFMVTTVSNM